MISRPAAILLLTFLLISSLVFGQDKTPYKHSFGGNGFTGNRNVSVTWLAERYDGALAWSSWGPQFFDSLMDTADFLGKNFPAGPYASSQEINLYEPVNPNLTYSQRLTDTTKHWLYIYATHYLDSLGISEESLVVHLADSYIDILQDGDGERAYSLDGLPLHKKRFTYQYWNNNSADNFYPGGYTWLANGYNPDSRRAIAYAYRRHFIEDSVKTGNGSRMFTAYFMDNQYRDGAAPRLYSYYEIKASSGGPTAGMDWIEQPGIENNANATLYFDNSTLKIDSTIAAVLDSTCDAHGLRRIKGFANINKFSPTQLSAVLPFVRGVSLEQPIDYAKGPSNWTAWYEMADTMAAHPEVSINWSLGSDVLCSSTPSAWNYDSSRICMMHYSFFLTVQDTNAYVSMMRFNDSTRWRPIYEVDFGEPVAPAYEVMHTGTSMYGADAYTYVMRRNYSSGAFTILRTAHGQADWVNDSILVDLGETFFEVSAYADTSAFPVTSTYLKPYEGKIFVPASACAAGPVKPDAQSPPDGAAVGNSPQLCVYNADHRDCEDPVTYFFEIAEDASFNNLVRQSGAITEGTTTSCFTTSAPLLNGRVYYWRARAYNGTSYSPYSNTRTFVTPNTPPPPPTGTGPSNGIITSETNPTLAASSVTDPDGTPVTYYFQVSNSVDFISLVTQSGAVSPGQGNPSWQISSALAAGVTYYWRVRAYDGIAYSTWSATMNFRVNAAPPVPTPLAPANQSMVNTSRPQLVVGNVVDPEGQAVQYFFQVSKFSNFSSIAAQSAAVNGGGGNVTWQVNVDLENGSAYFWRVRANDGMAYSNWMSAYRFTVDVNQTNHPPTQPTVYSPPDSSVLTYYPVILTWNNATDADGNTLFYDIQVYDSAGTAVLAANSGISQGGGGTTSYSPVGVLQNKNWYNWRVRAYDGEDYSLWMDTAAFYFDSLILVNQPPEAPALISPNQYDTLISLLVTLAASNSYDAEDDELSYSFAVYSDSLQQYLVDSAQGLTIPGTGTTVTWDVEATLISGSRYFWSCRAFDGSSYSDWAQARSFWVYDFSVDADQAVPVAVSPPPNVTIHQSMPILEVSNVTSGPGIDNLYYFEVSEDSGFTSRVYSGPIPEDQTGNTSWQVATPLRDGVTYFWRTRANNSPYSKALQFTVASEVYITPNPFRPSQGHTLVTIHNMDPEGQLTITNLNNEVVRVLRGNSGGTVNWDVRSSTGQPLASDFYICFYSGNGQAESFKFVVIR